AAQTGGRAPRRPFVVQLTHRRARPGVHAPQAARTIDMAAVGYEDQLASVGRPGGGQVMIPDAVVVARQPAVAVLRDTRDGIDASVAKAGDEHVPALVVRR